MPPHGFRVAMLSHPICVLASWSAAGSIASMGAVVARPEDDCPELLALDGMVEALDGNVVRRLQEPARGGSTMCCQGGVSCRRSSAPCPPPRVDAVSGLEQIPSPRW